MANFYQNVYKFCHQGELTCFKIVTTIKKLFKHNLFHIEQWTFPTVVCLHFQLFVYILKFCSLFAQLYIQIMQLHLVTFLCTYFFQNLMFNFLLVNLLVIVALFEWRPNRDEFYVVFVLAGLWGVSDAIWQTQINGKHKAAYKTIHFLLSLERRWM